MKTEGMLLKIRQSSAKWNMAKFAETLLTLIDEDEKKAVELQWNRSIGSNESSGKMASR
jgi:uncharacterized protein YdiU (UPF0061 family)